MFTGIITHTGTISRTSPSKIAIRADRDFVQKLGYGTSVSVGGVCLTVISKNSDSFSADIMPETARRTTLGSLHRGDLVNLEHPATPLSFLSGHIVQGHIDGIGTLRQIRAHKMGWIVSIASPAALLRYIVAKGSIAVNGISLTVIGRGRSYFTVGIIPHTWKTTTFHELAQGSSVNIEVDVLAKYVETFVRDRRI
ncbi:MAG: riboflavin synthase [Parcubacteria group bacterium Gr01-1014_8]|nr:MAG: riboflavin synthase [Parcubacteria group bacterium Gr01-1014_8]